MGLDTSHDCWHGAYSSFSRWRNALAEAAGYMFLKNSADHETVAIDWGHLQQHLMGEWQETPADPLLVLICHSDCDGVINVPQLIPLADRLEALLPSLPDGDGGGHMGGWRDTTKRFIAGLHLAANRNEPVEFH